MTDSDTLNGLLNGELRAAHLYWQAAAWCAERHMDGCSEFLSVHADEELTHMKRLFQFLIDSEVEIQFSALPAPKVEAETVRELFEAILAHEGKVTHAVGEAVKEAQAAGDHGTFEFLQWFVMEQRGEMKLFRQIVDRITLIGDGPQALYLIDQEVANIGASAAAADAATAQA
ncbi:MAG: ferritin [Pseudomonadota bacterium]